MTLFHKQLQFYGRGGHKFNSYNVGVVVVVAVGDVNCDCTFFPSLGTEFPLCIQENWRKRNGGLSIEGQPSLQSRREGGGGGKERQKTRWGTDRQMKKKSYIKREKEKEGVKMKSKDKYTGMMKRERR